MANNIIEEAKRKMKKSTKLTKKEAIDAVAKAYKSGDVSKLDEIRKNYSGDFEVVFRKGMDGDDEDDCNSQIDMLADRVIRNLTQGTKWMKNYSNDYQVNDIDKFRVYSLVIKMIDDGVYLPESILDERFMARINKAAEELGYEDQEIYAGMEKNEKGKYINLDKTKKCINPAEMDEKAIKKVKNDDLRAFFEIQAKDIENYLIETGRFDFSASDDDEEDKEIELTDDIDVSDLPHWMRFVRDARIADGDDEEDDDEEESNSSKKKSKKSSKKNEDDDAFEISESSDKKVKKELPKNNTSSAPMTQQPIMTQPIEQSASTSEATTVETPATNDKFDKLAELFEEKGEAIEKALGNLSEDQAKNLLNSDEFQKGFDALLNMISGATAPKEGAKRLPNR